MENGKEEGKWEEKEKCKKIENGKEKVKWEEKAKWEEK